MQLLMIALLVLLIGLEAFHLISTSKGFQTMGQGLTDLQAAIAAENTAIGQAILLLDGIPALITAAQGSDDPDAALETLAQGVASQTAAIKAGLGASGQTVSLTVSPAVVSFVAGVASTVPVTIGNGTSPFTASDLPAGVTYDGTATLVADGTQVAGTTAATFADSETPAVTGPVSIEIADAVQTGTAAPQSLA